MNTKPDRLTLERTAAEAEIAQLTAERDAALAELERVQKQAGQMRFALHCADRWFAEIGWDVSGDNRQIIRQALIPSAGKGYVPLEDVKPLVAALEYYTNATRKESSHLPPHRTWQGDDGLTARKALTHAKAKGLA